MANLLLEMTQVLDNTVYSKSEEMGTVCASGQVAPSNFTVINTEPGQVGGMQFLFGQGHKIGTFCDF